MKPIELLCLVLVLMFAAVGCEDKLNKLPEPTKTTEQIEQTQSHTEAALAGEEAEELGIIIERNVPVPMRDGTILRADVHRPDRGGPYPVLVRQGPLGKKGKFSRFVEAGYIVVSQDMRGEGGSEGARKSVFTPRELTHDAEDGYDTIEWAANLPNADGRVGTFGYSYEALLQWRLAPLRPPSLVAMSACSIMAHFDNEHGAFRPWWLDFSLSHALDMRRRKDRPGVHTTKEARRLWEEGEKDKWLNWLPWGELPRDFFEDETEAVHHWLDNPHIDPWRNDEGCSEITVPNLDVVGWYDYAHGNMLMFQKMVQDAGSENARKGSRLIIGPWTHGATSRRVGDMDFGSDAVLDVTALRIRWFDHWIKGVQNGIDKDAPVKIFVMGDNKWRDERHWPLKRAREEILFLTGGGCANKASGDGVLVKELPRSQGSDTYDYDPSDPVPTLGRKVSGRIATRTASDQRPLADRQDILVYQTEPLKERMEVTGFPVVELYAGSSTPDTDWFVRLIDVYPDGLALDVSQGIVRARYRNGIDKPELIKPGEVVKYTIRMKPTSNAFLPGHRIRLDITSSDFPNYDRNHNTAADQHADPTLVVARQAVFHGGSQATRIILPWVPNPEEAEELAKERDRPQPQQQAYALHQAAAAGDAEQVKRLISEGIDINLQDGKKNTPLCHAVRAGNMEVVQLLVKEGADVNAGLSPPLFVAVKVDNVAVAEHLIAQGANINLPKSWAPFQEAFFSGSVKMVELLMDKGADFNEEKLTVWQQAIITGRTELVELFLQRGIDANTKDKYGGSFLGFALRYGNNDIVELLLTRGADPKDILARSRKDKSGPTALHDAAIRGHKAMAKLLLENGENADERDDVYEFTALHYAVRFGNKGVAEVLIANGADIRAKDKWDYQPIHWAAYHDRADVVELLVSKGADINARTSLDQTPLQLAQDRRNTKTIELLRKHGAKE